MPTPVVCLPGSLVSAFYPGPAACPKDGVASGECTPGAACEVSAPQCWFSAIVEATSLGAQGELILDVA